MDKDKVTVTVEEIDISDVEIDMDDFKHREEDGMGEDDGH